MTARGVVYMLVLVAVMVVSLVLMVVLVVIMMLVSVVTRTAGVKLTVSAVDVVAIDAMNGRTAYVAE